MRNRVDLAISDLPRILRSPVRLWFERLAEQHPDIPTHLILPLVRVVACSEFAAAVISRDWQWFVENAASFAEPVEATVIDAFTQQILLSDLDEESVKSELRIFRNRYLLRILWCEVQGFADLDETLDQLSLLADRLLHIAMTTAERLLHARFGQVKNSAGDSVPLIVIGMGKLGGRELNFSSDIDLIFCYSEHGETDGARHLSAQEYFTRLTRLVIALIDEVTVDGLVFRVDTRLRPFGDSGPLVVSFAALESYLLQHGRDWERYAYVKARIVGRRPPDGVAHELHENLIRPFVYRRYLDYGVFESVRQMQQLIAVEVKRRELADNIKLGPGGIREAEFIVQALQLVRGGNEKALQSRELQKVLPRLVNGRGLKAADAVQLRDAYRFLRRLENFIQGIRDQQTHELPDNDLDRARLCLAMGARNWDELLGDLDRHRSAISRQFDAIASRGKRDDRPAEQVFRQLWDSGADQSRWLQVLEETGVVAADELARRIVEFADSPGTQQIDKMAGERLQRFIPKLIGKVIESARPDVALTRTLSVTERILRRSAYLALLNENEPAMSRLVDLCGQSQYIANQIARHPALMDELLDPQSFTDTVTRAEIADDMKRKLAVHDDPDSEAQMQAIAQFQRATMFRIAVADFNDKLPIMKVSDGLTWLAELVLEQALRVAWRDLTLKHGAPHYVVDGKSHASGFGIIAYGKLGGLELSYGSDLDIVFLHDSRGEHQETKGPKPLDNALFFSRLVRRLLHFLTTPTGSGELYEIDTRLRPDGRSGVLVSSTEAFERYQEDNAWTWEHQALLRARAVAGSPRIAEEFERIRRETLSHRVRRDRLREDVVSMRQKMRKELDRSGEATFDLKHGQGGIGDIEFLVQYLVLREAQTHPDVTVYSDNIRQLDALIAAGILDYAVGSRLQDIYRDYRLYLHRQVLDGRNAICDSGQFVDERQFVGALWDDWLG
ncbi:MAG TPA: bifunctional [glutamate--ammonia ligase]-adenylyl-L-tyrosine phosphorylase/[glutamate--ammonia-ligase] adenylyltransferase [Woeseiaceae bacterium]|nr:bifunctional [glutamate--ammonia ligase]-adenylyl-L-tyrosine phosphorylase/[glutamate--ammonia-ligase] adenylyltransferase [Woeseiaceae bacterium]